MTDLALLLALEIVVDADGKRLGWAVHTQAPLGLDGQRWTPAEHSAAGGRGHGRVYGSDRSAPVASSIQDGFSAKGLSEAKEKLDVLKLAPAERAAYERWQDDLHLQASLVASSYGLGKMEGREQGREERTLEIARAMKANGVAASVVAQSAGLDPEGP